MEISEWESKQEFQKLISESAKEPKVFVLAAKWCGYCTRFLSLAGDYDSEFELNLVNVDDPDESLWEEYNIRLVPTLIVFKNGKPLLRKDARPGVGLQLSDLEQALSVATIRGS